VTVEPAEPVPTGEPLPVASVPTGEPLPPGEPLPVAPVASVPSVPATPAIELVSTRRLLGASFELVGASTEDMRRASFYVGSIVLGTVGPLALMAWATSVVAFDRTPIEMEVLGRGRSAALATAGLIAFLGIIVMAVESRTLAVALLGSRVAGRPISPRQALARSRRVFWRAVVASIIVAIPLGIVQGVVDGVVQPMLGEALEASVVTTTLVSAVVGAPFAYVLSGVVLGDVDPFEAVRRSFAVFRARKLAAAVVVLAETIAVLLIFLGATTGLDLAVRVLDALGLGPDAGPAGLALMTGGLVAVVFAFGTLVFTVTGITVAPQVVMFVGLTHATMGLDRVRTGGDDDPDALRRPEGRRFRTYPWPMVAAFIAGPILLVVTISTFAT
jgi:hypothetical protein